MYSASLPMPIRLAELIARRKCSPTKYSPGTRSTTPHSCTGRPSSPKTGRSIHGKPGWYPVHQTMFLASSERSPASRGWPSRTPVTLGTRSMPASIRSCGFTRTSGAAFERSFGRTLRPIGLLTFSTWWPTNFTSRTRKNLASAVSIRKGTWPDSLPDIQTFRPVERAISIAMSAAEFPAPTTSTGPSKSCDGLE